MYSENRKITLRQLKRLLVFDLFGVISLVVPYVITTNTGYDGLLALCIGAVLVIVYLLILIFFMKNIKGSYIDFSKKTVGSVVTFIICILYMVKFMASIVMLIRLFTEVITTTLLQDYTELSIIIPMVIVAGYLAIKGSEVRARFAEVLYLIVLIPIFLLLLLGLKDIDIANLTPVFTVNPIRSLYGGYSYFLIFNVMELLLFIKHYIAPERKKRSIYTGIFSYCFQGLCFIFVFSLLYFVLTVGLIGGNAAQSKMFSSVMIMQLIKIPWTLLNRQDSLILGLWLISIFSILGAFLYYMCMMMKKMFKISNKKYIMPLLVVIVCIASAIPVDLQQYYEYYVKYITWIGLPQTFIIPIILLLVDRIRHAAGDNNKKTKVAVKSLSLVFMLLLVSGTLTSCSKQVEIQDREFVQAIAVDYNNNELTAYYVLPDLGAVTDQASTDSEKLIRTFRGKDFYDIEEQYKLCSSKKLDYSHLKAIIVGKSIVENGTVYKQFMNYVENNYKISKNVYVFLVEDDVKKIVDYNKNVENGIGDYLDRLYKNNLVNSEKEEIMLGTLINEKNSDDLAVQLPILTILNDSLAINGVGIVKDSKLQNVIKGQDTIVTDLLSGYGENSRIFIGESSSRYASFVIRLTNVVNNKTITIQNGKPLYKYYLQATGVVEKGFEELGSLSAQEKKKINEDLQNIVNAKLKNDLLTQLEDIVTKKEVDYLNIFRMVRYKNRELYNFYQENQLGFIKALKFQVNVDVRFY